jgi:predicted metalloprotease
LQVDATSLVAPSAQVIVGRVKRGQKLIVGGAALLAFGIIATGAIIWDRHAVSAVDPAAAEASEAAKARAAVPTTTPSPTADDVASAPPQPVELAKNPIYRVGRLSASRCPQPKQRPTTLANARAFYTELLGCLNKAWAPAIRKSGFTFTPPKLVVVNGQSPSSPCDVTDSTAYYCDNDTIYIDASYDIADWAKYGDDRVLALMTMILGHEYGHHVQRLTGILRGVGQWDLHLNGVDLALQESRRLELQANCFSGVYLGADQDWYPVTDSYLTDWQAVVRSFIDPKRDHGSTENAGNWSIAGYDAADPKACNTFTAAAPFVA